MSAPNSPSPSALDPDDDALGVNLVDDTVAVADDHRAGVLGDDRFHAGADDGRLGTDQRHRLALHVGTHERAVGVIVLEEGNQRRRHRHHLARRDIDEVDLLAIDDQELAAGSGDDLVVDQVALVVDLGVGLGDVEVLLFPGRKVEGVRLEPRPRASWPS